MAIEGSSGSSGSEESKSYSPPRPPQRTGTGTAQVRYVVRSEPALERIVRPFSAPIYWPDNIRRLPPEQDDREAFIQWGASINVNVTTLDAMGIDSEALTQWVVKMLGPSPDTDSTDDDDEDRGNKYQEKSRIVDVVRISDPNNSANYVDVERISRITFVGPNGPDIYELRNGGPAGPTYE